MSAAHTLSLRHVKDIQTRMPIDTGLGREVEWEEVILKSMA